MRTTVFEVEGLGRVGEWLDYGNDEAGTVAAIAAAGTDREALRECLEALKSCRQITCDSEGADDPGGCDHCTALAAITRAEKVLGEA